MYRGPEHCTHGLHHSWAKINNTSDLLRCYWCGRMSGPAEEKRAAVESKEHTSWIGTMPAKAETSLAEVFANIIQEEAEDGLDPDFDVI